MRCRLLLVFLLLLSFGNAFSQNNLWTDVKDTSAQRLVRDRPAGLPQHYRLIMLNRTAILQLQRSIPLENLAAPNFVSPIAFEVPLPQGGRSTGSIMEAPVLSNELSIQYPNIKTYRMIDPANKRQLGRLTITDAGVSGLIFTENGSLYIAPVGDQFPGMHMVYYVKDVRMGRPIACGTREDLATMRPASPMAGDCQLRTFRLAIAATGEYTTWAGGQANAIGYITTTVNNVTAIYERDATIRFTLVTNNSIVFTNAASDPYSTVAFPSTTTLSQNQAALDANIGSGNYDLGMVFNNGWNGGLASLAVVCNNLQKGRSAAGMNFGTGPNPTAGPQGPIFDGTVAHELAHEFSATHSFAADNAGCAGNTSVASSWEPGGGSTIMAYAGVCSGNFYQPYSDLYFHAGSIAQILSYATSGSASCAVTTSTGNSAPTISVPAASYTIPISTPFSLTSTGSDADGNALSYTWEQMDPAGAATSLPPSATATSGPNFRSFPPGSSSTRTFPIIDSIIAGISPTYEVLPSVSRVLNFTVTARDGAAGGGCTSEANVGITTDASAGPFVVTSQSAPVTWTANGSNTASITWNVAGTNAGAVNCAAVDILFSIDGGHTYPYTLVSNTPNDGSQVITIPNLPTYLGRVRVQARNNVFFNINTANITISSSCSAEGSTFTPTANVAATAGSATLDLSLSPLYGNVVSPSGTITNADPAGFLAVNYVAAPNCTSAANTFYYQTFTFTPSVPGTYTFQLSGGAPFGLVENLYSGTSFSPNDPCASFMGSSATFDTSLNAVVLGSSISANLTPGAYYTLAVGTFSNSLPTLPASYTITVTAPGGGNIYDYIASPGGAFNYTYVIVNNATGNITAIDPGANLSNSGTFPGGTDYTIYGLSYSNNISLATLNSYVGGPFANLQNDILYNAGTLCSNLSKNQITVNVLATTPVTFLGLTASKSGENALLRWKTASEQNNDHFEVQRSANGTDFNTDIAQIPAAGNSNTIIEYSFTDKLPMPQNNYYRIKQVDKDGRSSLSNVAVVRFDRGNAVLQVYPNPAASVVYIDYIASLVSQMDIQVLDSKGAMVNRKSVRLQPGRNLIPVELGRLSRGVYIIKTIAAGNTVVKRLLKE